MKPRDGAPGFFCARLFTFNSNLVGFEGLFNTFVILTLNQTPRS